jgi:hypothetical protein
LPDFIHQLLVLGKALELPSEQCEAALNKQNDERGG